MTTIYLASGNAHKVNEFAVLAAAANLTFTVGSARDLGGMPDVVEDTGTFEGNAAKKASALRATAPTDAWVLADDSGLCVDALDGAPGVESAYYAGPAGDSAANLAKLVEAMQEVPAAARGAGFVCVLHLIDPTGNAVTFRGECRGSLRVTPAGGGGFGYDPLFVPNGFSRSFAELGDLEKNALSHRARAWAKLVEWWRTHG